MSKSVSPAMIEHMRALSAGERKSSAYPALSLNVLCALRRRGYVESKRRLGSVAPATWGLTDKGREFLASQEIVK